MLSRKELGLLEVLLQNTGQYVTSVQLASEIGVSDRTARKYLQQIQDEVAKHGAVLQSKQGLGYLLDIQEKQRFEKFWQDELLSKRQLKDVTQVAESIDRQHYILNKLLLEDVVISQQQLCQELFISQTTLASVLTDIRKQLAPYSLQLTKRQKGLAIVGKEQDKRHFIMDYFFVDSFDKYMFGFVGDSFLEKDINFSELTIIVLDECREARLKRSDYVIHNLVLHIALMVKRIQLGHELALFDIPQVIRYSDEYRVALKILFRVEEVTNVRFPLEEANYIALHLMVKNSTATSLLDEETQSPQHLEANITRMLQQIDQEINTQLASDTILFNGLLAHFNPLLIRLENKIQLSNPLLADVKKQYLEIFELTKRYFKTLPELNNYPITDDEWAYIALHIMAALERQANRMKLKTLVVCATGYGSAMMLKNRLEKELGSNLAIVDVISYYEITEQRLKDIDVIISSISLSNLLFPTPVIHVSVFLPQEDVQKIRQFMAEKQPLPSLTTKTAHSGEPLVDNIIHAVFHPQRFVVYEHEVSKAQVVADLIHSLSESHQDGFFENFLSQVELRESYSPVVFGDELAFPHPAVPLGFNEEVAVAICKQPLYWDEQHPQIKFVFLMSPSKGKNTNIKRLSPCLVDFVEDTANQQLLLSQPTFQQLATIFKQLLQKNKR